MKTLFALLLVLSPSLFAQMQKLELGSHGRLTLYLDDGWKFETADYGDRQMVSVVPKGDANASCALTITFPEQDRYDTRKRLSLRVEVNGQPLAERSVEGRSTAKEFSLQSGFGFYCNFTDPDLVGKASEKVTSRRSASG
jgi:hypothetical protein